MSSIAAIAAGFSAAGAPTSAYNGASVIGDAGVNALLDFSYFGGVVLTGGSAHTYSNWYLPNVNGIGSLYWAKATLIAGSVFNQSVGFGVVQSLDQAFHFTFECSSPTNPTATIRVQIYSDAGGVTQVADGTVTITAT